MRWTHRVSVAARWFLLRWTGASTSTLLVLHHLGDLVLHVVVEMTHSSSRTRHSCPLGLLLPPGAGKELGHGGLDGSLPRVHRVRRVGRRGGRGDRLVHRSAWRLVRPPGAAGRTCVLHNTLDHPLVRAQARVGVARRSRLAWRPAVAFLRVTSPLPVLVLGAACPRIWRTGATATNLLADHVLDVFSHRAR